MAAKPKSLRSYADKYGCSHEHIRKLKAEGVDLEDEAAVKGRLETDSASQLPLTVPQQIQGSGLRAAIQRLQAAEVAAHTDYLNALQNAPEAAGRALKAWQTILDQLRKAEVENPAVERENSQTVSKDELAAVLGTLFRNLRTDLEAMPRKVGLMAGDKKDEVEEAARGETNRIIDGLYACSFLS